MRCAIECLLFLGEFYKKDTGEGIAYLESKLNEKGISVYDLCEALELADFKTKAIKSLFFPQGIMIILLKGKKTGHFMVVLNKSLFTLKIYDSISGVKKVNKLLIYFLWTHISIRINEM